MVLFDRFEIDFLIGFRTMSVEVLTRLFDNLTEMDRLELLRIANVKDDRPPILRGLGGASAGPSAGSGWG